MLDAPGSESSNDSRPFSPSSSASSPSSTPSVANGKPSQEVTEDDKATAASIKADANKAFQGLSCLSFYGLDVFSNIFIWT